MTWMMSCGFGGQQFVRQAEQKAAVPGEFDGGAFLGGELRPALLARLARPTYTWPIMPGGIWSTCGTGMP